MNSKLPENVVIIGGGVAGLSTAIYLGRANLNPLLIAGSPAGGQLTLTSEVENYPGYESILGAELIAKMRNQAKKFGTRIVDKNVIKVNFKKTPFEIYYSGKSLMGKGNEATEKLLTKSVLIGTGAKALWLGLESEQRLRGKGVSACATCDGFFFRDKTVAVVGGGDTALEEALTLTKFAKKVYIIHRRESFRASKIMQERVLSNQKIEIIWNTVVEDILGKEKVEGLRLKSVSTETNFNKFQPISTDRQLKVDGLFIAIGHKPDTDLFKGQIDLDEKGYILTTNRIALENFQFTIFNFQSNNKFKNLNIKNSLKIKNFKLKIPKFDYHYQYQTSVKGVFAAGDCVDSQYQQAATAAGMGVAAALDIEKFLES